MSSPVRHERAGQAHIASPVFIIEHELDCLGKRRRVACARDELILPARDELARSHMITDDGRQTRCHQEGSLLAIARAVAERSSGADVHDPAYREDRGRGA